MIHSGIVPSILPDTKKLKKVYPKMIPWKERLHVSVIGIPPEICRGIPERFPFIIYEVR